MQQKIIVMTQLALYDKHESVADQNANDYFRHDYIYRKNLATRIAVGIGGFVILILYWARNIFIHNEVFALSEIFETDFSTYLSDSIFFMLAIIALYSFIGTIQGTREYYLVQKRLTRYHALVRQLERINERAEKAADENAEKIENTAEAITPTPRPERPPRRLIADEDDDNSLAHTRRVDQLDIAPPVYKNPFPTTPKPPQRSAEEIDRATTDNPRNPD